MADRTPFSVDVTEHLWIPMPDGTRLAARMWMPKGAGGGPVPAIFEYIPYRKADMVRARDERTHPYFAAHGYACLRVDMRGSGDSDGHMPDMYAQAELDDARAVIDWIAQQAWCNGAVGMFGTSWGGTASLQANLDAPDALKAVIAVCATHDRFEDDIHHKGGAILGDTLEWGATLPTILGAPPTPLRGDDWRELWQDRINALAFPVEHWVAKQGRGAYWRHGSVIHQAARLRRPILAVGGWSDRYSNSVMSLVDARPDLAWGIVGPWGHHYPDHGHPGPAVGFQDLALEWWEAWLKPDTPDYDAPRLRAWLCEFEPPRDVIDVRHGRWVQSGGPAQDTRPVNYELGPGALIAGPGHGGPWPVPLDLRVGMTSSDTGYFGRYGGLPAEQGQDDARSLVFETPPLTDDLILFGAAELALRIDTGAFHGHVSLRLNDVAPDGASARVTFAIRNLALDDALDSPAEAFPERRTKKIRFPTKAHRFRAGHRLRLSMSASYWPMVFPLPSDPARILSGALRLPCHPAPADLAVPLPAPRDLPARKTHSVLAAPKIARFARDGADGTLVAGWDQPAVRIHYQETETTFAYRTRAEHRVQVDDPASAVSHYDHHMTFERPDGTATVHATATLRYGDGCFHLKGAFEATWKGEVIGARHWDVSVPVLR